MLTRDKNETVTVCLTYSVHVLQCFDRHSIMYVIRFNIISGRPVRSAAMPVLFLLSGPKMGFSPRRGDMLPRLTWNLTRGTGERTSPCQILRLSGRKCGNTAPKTVKISNFCQKFVPQGRLVCNIFTKFSRVYSYCFLLWFVVLVLV